MKTVLGVFFTALILLASAASSAAQSSLSTIVLIVDDMGNNFPLGKKALQLPGPINYAFLPHRDASKALAEEAHKRNKEVMLHAPMSNLHNKPLGKGGLTEKMDRRQFLQVLQANIDSVPHVRGVNNHMGSLLTQMPLQMSWLMETLKQQQLYFIDSRTSAKTAAENMAHLYQLPNLRRHVFLDNERDTNAINAQFEKLLKLARRQDITVAIGHPYPETLALLQDKLPTLQLRGYRLALISDALAKKNDCLIDRLAAILLGPSCTKATTVQALAYLPPSTLDG